MHLASQGILSGWSYNENKYFRSPRLKFNSDNYIRFLNTIGFIETRKVVHTEGCVKNPYHRRRINNSFRVSVKSIEYKTNDVYDLHVPETHSFVSNGLISHNTGRLSSAEPNMQNIPSHATDIRHMFRATPQADYQLESDIDADNCVQFVIDNGHKIQTDKGYKFVTDLVVNDEVILFDMDKEVKCNVQEINIEGPTTRICFHVI